MSYGDAQARSERRARSAAEGESTPLKKPKAKSTPWSTPLKEIVVSQITVMTTNYSKPALSDDVSYLKLNYPSSFDTPPRKLTRGHAEAWWKKGDVGTDDRQFNTFGANHENRKGRKVPPELRKELLALMNSLSKSSAEINAVSLQPHVLGYVMAIDEGKWAYLLEGENRSTASPTWIKGCVRELSMSYQRGQRMVVLSWCLTPRKQSSIRW
jgi:hypothetical protein